MPIKIHKFTASPPSRVALMAAELLKLNYEAVDVDLFAGEHVGPEFLQKNPLHLVPVLEDGDFTLVDSHAIIAYLVSKYGADKRAELYPGDLRARAIIDSKLYFDASLLFPRFQTVVRAIMGEKALGPTEKQEAEIVEAYGFLEKFLQRSTFVAADHITIADVVCISTLSTSNIIVPVDAKFEKIHQWWDTLKTQDWYKKVNEAGLVAFSDMVKFLIEKNKSDA